LRKVFLHVVRAVVKEQRKEHTKNSLRSISFKPMSSDDVFVVVLLKDKKKEGKREKKNLR